ncbi:MAG: hypothetical protein MUO53_00700 [Maribacter sp.]|nr:hypothetical protein [Maribacter sp.]
MKKHFIAAITLVLALLIGCSKDNVPPIDRSANLMGTGESAHDILANDPFDKIQIQIAYVTGFRPTNESMANFQAYLQQHTFKTSIELVYLQLASPNKDSLSLQEIADLEKEHRTVYNSGSTLGVYIYFADAPAADDDDVQGLVTLGAVFRNTSMVIHEVTVRKLAGKSTSISVADVETATLNHEFGHLSGLVNLGTAMVNQHEDPNSVNHCDIAGCLMRSELQFSGATGKNLAAKGNNGLHSACSLQGEDVLNLLQTQASKGLVVVPDLDSECVLDLQANGGR